MLGDNVETKKWTLEEALNECEEMEKGKKHFSEDYIAKVGVTRPCRECGKPVDTITYSGFDLDWLSITYCDEHRPESPIKPPFKKCTDEECPVHKHFDEEKHYHESLEIDKTISEVKALLNKVKPESDSILEYDRIYHIFGHTHPHMKPADYEFWLYNEFINYVTREGKLRLRNGV